MNYNRTTIVGRLGETPTQKVLTSGTSTTTFSIAVNETWKDKDGQKQERTNWFRVVAFGKLAEVICQYAKKGSQMLISGKLQNREYEQDGVKKYITEIIAQDMQFGAKASNEDGSSQVDPQQDQADGIDYPDEDINPEDIPF